MADVQTPKPAAAAPAQNAGGVSLSDLDKLLEAEDPGFKDELAKIKAQKVEGTDALNNLNVDAEELKDENLDADNESRAQKLLRLAKKPFINAWSYIKLQIVKFKNRAIIF